MKRIFTILATIVCAIIVPETLHSRVSKDSREPDTLRILSVANSFGVDAVEQNLHEMALADGHVLIIGNMYIGGCNLELHYLNSQRDDKMYSYRKIAADGSRTKEKADFNYCVDDEPWDVVIFHQASALSGETDSYEPYLGDLIRHVRARLGRGCRIMLNQTWAYAENSTHKEFYRYHHSQTEMYEALCKAYSAAARRHRLPLIPSGTAVQNSRATFNHENVTRDGYHMHMQFGRYLIACTYYESICGNSVLENTYQPPHLSPERIEIARKCAHEACLHPYVVTRINYAFSDADWDSGRFNDRLESIRSYTLPDALTMRDGRKVTTPGMWYSERRPELMELFDTEMFGKAPGIIDGTTYEIIEENGEAFGGLAVRRQLRIHFNRKDQYISVLMYLPAGAQGPVPVFMGLNFEGNHTVNADTAIVLPSNSHVRQYGVYRKCERGSQASRWPVEELVRRGYGLVTFHTSDIDPDFDDGFRNGVSSFIYRDGQDYPDPDQWGTISAWAWGMSRVMDYLEADPDVDASRVAAIGHSRLGKTALLAGARDTRFAMVVSNSSGCGGAALSRRHFGETVWSIQRYFPHWFCGNFVKYAEHEDDLPFDQHELLALIAPRPLYVASAENDGWADPVGERLSLQEAQKVYDFLGLDRGLTGYHIRQGGHELTLEDWLHYLDFADRYLR